MDHFSKTAVKNYFSRFEKAFAEKNTPYPHNFFNDSYSVYEVYFWTGDMFEQFIPVAASQAGRTSAVSENR